MHLPVFPLQTRGFSKARGRHGVFMVWQWKVSIDKDDGIFVGIVDLLNKRFIGGAGRALEIAILNQDKLGCGTTLDLVLLTNDAHFGICLYISGLRTTVVFDQQKKRSEERRV